MPSRAKGENGRVGWWSGYVILIFYTISNSTKPTKQGVINILATFGNGRKSGLRVRPSLTKHLCDLDVLRLTQGETFFPDLHGQTANKVFIGPNKDFRITAAFREQRYSNDLEVFCIYVGYRLESSNFEFKVKEPRRSGIMVSRLIMSKAAWALTNDT